MSKIKLSPDQLINQIAAGEVVEASSVSSPGVSTGAVFCLSASSLTVGLLTSFSFWAGQFKLGRYHSLVLLRFLLYRNIIKDSER